MSRYPGDTKKCCRATRYFAQVFRRDTRPGTASANITAIAALPQTRDRVMFEQVHGNGRSNSKEAVKQEMEPRNHNHDRCTAVTLCREISYISLNHATGAPPFLLLANMQLRVPG